MMQFPITILAPAKLNLFLGVHNQKNAQGYHRVDSIMAAVDLFDTITITPASTLRVTCTPPVDFPEHTNSCYKVMVAMQQAFNITASYHIHIQKQIPFKSGLGGASSDAASVLTALCLAWNISKTDDRVVQIARQLGADVSFFLHGMPLYLSGVGDIPTEFYTPLQEVYTVLIRPYGDGITAKDAYDEFDRLPSEPNNLSAIRQAMQSGKSAQIALHMFNSLEDVSFRLMPHLKQYKQWLSQQDGVLHAMVTGSGSCIYGVCRTLQDATRIAQQAKEQSLWSHAGKIINSTCIVKNIDTIKNIGL